jgi:hypothetical protein
MEDQKRPHQQQNAGFPLEVVTLVCLHVTGVEVIENSCRFDDSRRITAAVRGYKSETEDFGPSLSTLSFL